MSNEDFSFNLYHSYFQFMFKFFSHRFKPKSANLAMPKSVATRNIAIRYMVKAIPAGMRRLILLSSLIAYITNTNKPEHEFVKNIDRALRLSRGGSNSLEFPIRLSRVFWGHRELFKDEIEALLDPHATNASKQLAACSIASMVPDWFIYASPSKLVEDLVQYFSIVPEAQVV